MKQVDGNNDRHIVHFMYRIEVLLKVSNLYMALF
jgi:hypothetical protein